MDWLLGQFGTKKKQAQRRYREFVREGIGKEDKPWEQVKGNVYLGGDGFVKGLKGRIKDRGLNEVPREQREAIKIEMKKLMGSGGTAAEIEKAREEGYSMKEIARYLGIHYSAVTQRVKRNYQG